MDVHKNARTTPLGRRMMMRRLAEGWTVRAVAAAFAVDPTTVRKWRRRFASGGDAGLLDRSSRPHRSPRRLDETSEAEIEALRRERLSGPAIALKLGRPVSTVGRVLRRRGLGRLAALEPKPQPIRYQRQRPGELVHIDIKKLGRIDGVGHRITGDRTARRRGAGWDFLHVCVDDASRLAFTRILPNERKESAVLFLDEAITYQALHPAHQWQGRALHPELPARVGLCPPFPELGRTHRRHARLDLPLQHPQASRRSPRPATHLKADPGQPPWK